MDRSLFLRSREGRRFLPVIGLEVHVELKTRSKMFCSCSVGFGAGPNTNICPVCTGQPGALPVPNVQAVKHALIVAHTLRMESINRRSVFARKNYYYPDLPKNYQISQYELPIATGGCLEVKVVRYHPSGEPGSSGSAEPIPGTNPSYAPYPVRITRIHLEEDAGKLLHDIGSRELDHTLVDYNRAATPLLEIVTEPCLHCPADTVAYLETLQKTLRHLGVSDCDMEKGAFRCDANISVTETGDGSDGYRLGVKTELKNMNSFEAIRVALEHEIERHIATLARGGRIVQETRLWDAGARETVSMRSKEEAHDYRYFPDPDLPPLVVDDHLYEETLAAARAVTLPYERERFFVSEYGLDAVSAGLLTERREVADFYERAVAALPAAGTAARAELARHVANIMTRYAFEHRNEQDAIREESAPQAMRSVPGEPGQYAELALMYHDGTLSSKLLGEVFRRMLDSRKSPRDIVAEQGLVQITDEAALERLADEIMAEHPQAVADLRAGKSQAIGALIGAAMKKTAGKADPRRLTALLKRRIASPGGGNA